MENANRNLKQEMPEIMDYLDYRAFLRDRVEYMSSVDSKYSQRWFAKRAGFKSPHLLSMIISGQRKLNVAKVNDLAKAFKLETQEKEYFEIIVNLSQAEDQKVRGKILEKIKVSFRNGLFSGMSDEGLEIIRDWYIPAIREMISLDNFNPDSHWIAEVLGISADEVDEAIDLLLEKGFIKRNGLSFERSEPSIHTLDKCPPMLVSKFHLQMMDKAFAAISQPDDQRYYESLTFAMPRKLLPHLIKLVKRFCRETDTLIESHENRDEIFQLNIQLFQLSRCSVGLDEKGNRND